MDTADRSAKLVLLHPRTLLAADLQEGIVRVQHVVAKELPHRAVAAVPSGLRNHIGVRTSVTPESGVVVRRVDLELLQRIGVRNGTDGLLHEIARAARSGV